MAYTLKNFLDEHIVPEISLLTEAKDFSKIAISSSLIEEPPFDEFFEPDILVITKVMGWEHDEDLMEELIHIAKKAKVAALVWALHERRAAIPQRIIDLANQQGVALFQIPWEYPFAKIQEDLHDAIRQKEMALYEGVQQDLLHRFFESTPLEDTAPAIAHAFQRPVEIVDEGGQSISKGGELSNARRKGKKLSVPITISGIKYGELLFYLHAKEDPLEEELDRLEKYVAFPLSLWYNRQNIEHVTESRVRNDFVWNLASGNFLSLAEMGRQSKALGFDLDLPYTCITMKMNFAEEEFTDQAYTRENANIAAGVELLFQREAAKLGHRMMTASLNLDFVLFLENLTDQPARDTEHFLDHCERLLKKSHPEAQFLWGISESPTTPSSLQELYRQALQALTYCLNSPVRQQRFTYRNTRKATIVSVLSQNEEIKKAADEVFHDLLEYDKHSHVELMQTLAEYIYTNFNASQTAKNLHLNRQSLLYRLKKIEQLTGMSLHDNDDLFVLEVLSRIYISY